MKASPLSYAGTLAVAALVLQGTAALTACGGGGSSTGGASTTTATGGGTTSSSSTSHTTSTTTSSSTSSTSASDGGTGGSASDAAVDAGSDLCTQTGGTVTMIDCTCPSTGDFPSTCTAGACTCAPGQSHMVLQCNCPGAKCYDPTVGCMLAP